jgi:FkbM family methyltransferase
LLYREAIGSSVLLYGDFEGAEIRHLLGYVEPGSVAIDVGANIGIFTIPLAKTVVDGFVLAFEPHPGNVERLTSNIERNKLSNVEVIQAAAGDCEGTIQLQLASDPAFHSVVSSETKKGEQDVLSVRQRQIDLVWNELDRPVVSAIKIDVEGAEIPVLRGCQNVLATCGPALLIEAASEERLEQVTTWLTSRGYAASQPTGFAPWNFLFLRTAVPVLGRS